MCRFNAGLLCLAVLVSAGWTTQADETKGGIFKARENTGWTKPLQDLGIDGTLNSMTAPRPWTVNQVSSYDRTGGPNDDAFAHQVYDGGVVLADLQGPGSVMRLWSRNPSGTIMVYIDDMLTPVIYTPFAQLFEGDLELSGPGSHLFAPPFAGEGSGGFFSYVPIPYAERCRIIVVGGDENLSYQVTYADFPAGTPIRSFEFGLSKDDASYFRRWRKAWSDTDFKSHDRKTEKIHSSSTIIHSNANSMVYAIDGPGVITEFEMTVDSFDPEHFQNIWLAVYFDGQTEPGVLAPIGDFFGTTHVEGADYDGLVMGNIDGRMWCRYPMPFKSFAEIRVINVSEVKADFKYSIIWRPGPVHDQQYFHARYNSGTGGSGGAYSIANLTGGGHFAGCTISARNARSLEILEGDDSFQIDGRPISAYHGTGTDDYFNSGSYFATGTYSSTLHAVTLKIAESETGFSAFRNHVTEPVPFTQSLKFELERSAQNDVEYSSVAYWYQAEKQPKTWPIVQLEGVRNLVR